MSTCARYDRPADIDEAELATDGRGTASLLPVLIPPDGWLGDPDGDGVVCATADEITHWIESSEIIENGIDHLRDV